MFKHRVNKSVGMGVFDVFEPFKSWHFLDWNLEVNQSPFLGYIDVYSKKESWRLVIVFVASQ